MAKKEIDAADDDEDGEAPEGATAAGQGFVKKLLGNKKLLIVMGVAVLLLLGGGGAGLYFFVLAPAGKAKTTQQAAQIPPTPPQIAFYNVPDLIVNLQTADGTPAYLKLSVVLELAAEDEKPGIQALMPRIVDQFQGYLRELRLDDIKGSVGVVRLKEELLRRINVAAAPYRVRDVLLKEMIVQ